MQKPYTLIIPSWYPTASQPLNGIFIQKHVEAISTFRNVVVMYTTGAAEHSIDEKALSDSYTRYTYSYAESSSRGLNQLKYIWSQFKVYRYISDKYGRPDAIHLHVVFPAGIFVYLLLKFVNIPLVITEHWSGYTAEDSRFAKQNFLIKKITKELFRKARKVSVVSEYLKSAIIKWGLAGDNKMMISSNVLNIRAERITKSEGRSPKGLFIGNLNDHEKNVSLLIEAVGIVAQKYPSFQLTLVGGGVESQRFIDLAQAQGLLNKNIHFEGYVPNAELGPFYANHDFFILTSNFETFNIAAAEALLSGMPVVSTKCGGPAEFINDSNGIWIQEKTPQATATAIVLMIEKYGAYDSQKMAMAMRDKYGYDSIVTELKSLYV